MKQASVGEWECPTCGRHFSRRGQRHVCSEWTVDDHLLEKDDQVVGLFWRFVRLVEDAGPFEFTVTKTAVGFRGTRRGFAGATLTKRGLEGFLDLPRRVESPRFRKVSPYTQRLFVHRFLLTTEEELDAPFAGWVQEAYLVGQGAHLGAADSP